MRDQAVLRQNQQRFPNRPAADIHLPRQSDLRKILSGLEAAFEQSLPDRLG
jgi:hypothetical protein